MELMSTLTHMSTTCTLRLRSPHKFPHDLRRFASRMAGTSGGISESRRCGLVP